MKMIILTLVLASCAAPKPKSVPKVTLPDYRIQTVQERIMSCYKDLKRLGENGKQAGEFCRSIYKESN